MSRYYLVGKGHNKNSMYWDNKTVVKEEDKTKSKKTNRCRRLTLSESRYVEAALLIGQSPEDIAVNIAYGLINTN